MRILQITAGAAGMYCGSCLMDNALATELLARGEDVILLPVYTPDADRRGQRQRQPRVLRGDQRLPRAARAASCARARPFLDRLWDAVPVIRAATGRGISVDPHALGELDRLHPARARRGTRPRSSGSSCGYLDHLPSFDLALVPNALLISLAPALRRELDAAGALHASGRGPLPRGPGRDAPRGGEGADPPSRRATVDGFVATSDYYADFMASYLGLDREKIHTVPIGINLEGHVAETPRRPRAPSSSATSPASPPRRACTSWPRPTASCARTGASPSARLEVARLSLPRAPAVPRRDPGAPARVGPGERVPLSRDARPRGQDRLAAGPGRPVRPQPLRRAQGALRPRGPGQRRPLRPATPRGLPRGARAHGGGVLFEPNDPATWPSTYWPWPRDREGTRALGRRGAEGVRQHHSIARMADRALAVYRSVTENATMGSGPES